ncbi:MAG: glucoamylase family protein, partial [Bacteroidales bacterium]|nr:glucoamylase family protein [Bacteroidales bacterium]
MKDFTLKLFYEGIKTLSRYYKILVRETSDKHLVGSTNEWVLDNFYLVNEQEKALKEELKDKELKRLTPQNKGQIGEMLYSYLHATHFAVDKDGLMSHINDYQQRRNYFFSYKEVEFCHILMRIVLIHEIGVLTHALEKKLHASDSNNKDDFKAAIDSNVAENMKMTNLFMALKAMSKLKMEEIYENCCFAEKLLMKEKAGIYSQMHDNNKGDYRNQLMRMARKQHVSEYKLAQQMVRQADREHRHVGWLLFPPKPYQRRATAYVLIVASLTLVLSTLLGWALRSWWAAALTLIPAAQFVIELFNNLLFKLHKPVATFKLKFEKGIPEECATMVIMPTILKSGKKAKEMLHRLEVYYLSNKSDNLYFTLLGDASAESSERMPFDEEVAHEGMKQARLLNEKYGKDIFHFAYRRRKWSDGESQWLGLERKRGAILHLNDLLLGHMSEEDKKDFFFAETLSGFAHPIKYVITLDTDTQLVLHSAFALIGAMAHPLNRPTLSKDGRRVVSGYGLMQPLVRVDVEVTNKSRYAQLFSGLGGLDVYTTANFELYQDIFNEGSFCGKGIYDLHVFQHVLKGAFPRNLILSHDLLEGCYVRAGLINDVELFDDSPSNYLDDAKRHHRWTRGDWQIAGWLRNKVRNENGETTPNPVNTIGRWKIFDNLRRSVTALALLALLLFGLVHTGLVNQASGSTNSQYLWYLLITCVVIITPVLFFIFGQMAHIHRFFNRKMKYYAKLLHGIYVVLSRSFLQLSCLPKEAYLYTDALLRSLYRMTFSHKNLLNWVTSEDAERTTLRTLGAYCRQFWINYACAALFILLAFMLPQSTWVRSMAWALAAIWCLAPIIFYLLGLPFGNRHELDEKEKDEVKEWAGRTWHFFDAHINEENNYLIPDNYQLNRAEKTDYKTSPTNIGFSLLALICASKLGYISDEEATERLEHVIDTIIRLPKWNGHLYNWYDIHSLEALPPFFVSTCDSGNFVASLFVVKGYLSTIGDNKPGKYASLLQKVLRLIDASDFGVFYNHNLDVFSIGYDKQQGSLLPYHYNNFASEARLTSYLAIAKGDAPFKHWFCLDKTLIRYKGYKGVASWYGTLFEYFMPLIFLRTYRHTLMDETYSFAVMAQRSFINQIDPNLPWGISETAYHDLDDAQNYKYQAFGVPYLKFQNTTPNRIVISPYSSLLSISVDDRAVVQNMQKFKKLGSYDNFGFYESYDENDHANVAAHFAHHQGMILASLTNYLCNNAIQDYFQKNSQMQSIEALLKEKVQLRPYIDMQASQYKRYTYDHSRQESDVREFSALKPLPEIGFLSNGAFTVLLNDRGAGFVRYKDIYINRYRQISSEYHGSFMYIRNMATDKVWSNTYAPTQVEPDQYRVVFAGDRIKYLREDDGIATTTEICVVSDRNTELRSYTFENRTNQEVLLEITTYAEIIMCRKQDDIAHRVFNGMTVFSEYDPQSQALIFSKKTRGDRAKEYFVVNKLFFEHENALKFEYETSRLHFMGRGGSTACPDVIRLHGNLSNTVGTTLDPIMSFRRQIRLAPGQSETAYQLTGFGKSREQVLKMAHLFSTPLAIKDAFGGATVFNNMRIALSPLTSRQMALYNSMSKFVYETASLGMERRGYMAKNTLSQRGLWRYGISGDLPLLLLEINKAEQFAFVKEMLQAFEYYKSRSLFIDLVIVNDEVESQRDALRLAIDEYAGQLRTRRYFDNPSGSIHVLNGSEVGEPERNLLHTVARLWFSTATGLSLEEQLQEMEKIYSKHQNK